MSYMLKVIRIFSVILLFSVLRGYSQTTEVAFKNGGLEYLIKNGIVSLNGPQDYSEQILEIPEKVVYKDTEYPVSILKSSAFSGNQHIEKAILPNTIKEIQTAFYKSSLEEINIPEGVETLAFNCFYMTALKEITFPSSIINMGHSILRYCADITSADLSRCANITTIQKQFFDGCTSLQTAELPPHLSVIEISVFKDCNSLVSITCANTEVPTLGTEATFENIFQNVSNPSKIKLYVPEIAVENYKKSWLAPLNILAIPNNGEQTDPPHQTPDIINLTLHLNDNVSVRIPWQKQSEIPIVITTHGEDKLLAVSHENNELTAQISENGEYNVSVPALTDHSELSIITGVDPTTYIPAIKAEAPKVSVKEDQVSVQGAYGLEYVVLYTVDGTICKRYILDNGNVSFDISDYKAYANDMFLMVGNWKYKLGNDFKNP